MPLTEDLRYTGAAVAGPVESALMVEPQEPAPSLLEVVGAAGRQATLAGAAYQRFIALPDPDGPDAPPDFDPLDHVEGFEHYANRFIGAETPAEVEGIKSRIRAEEADREVLRRGGLGGPAAEIVLNLLDPSLLAAVAVPEIAIAKAARMGSVIRSALQGAAVAGTYETGMHALQETRTGTESGINVAAGAFLGGVLGVLIGRAPRETVNALNDTISRELSGAPRSEVGAARAAAATTLEQETLATGGETFSKAVGAVPLARTDLQVVLAAESTEARRVLQDLADVPVILEKNVQGIETPTSVESLIIRHEGRVGDFVTLLNDQWRQYRSRVPRGERMSRADFEAAVASAARRGDESPIPEIQASAQQLRAQVFDPLKEAAQRLGLLPADVEVVGAESYFRRMYDRNRIRAERREWDSILTKHFLTKGVTYAEARSIAEDVTRSILGADVGQANFNIRTHVPHAGPLHERVLDIPDELIERFLVNDPVKVASSYVRELAPQIEITRRFGDKDMTDAFHRVKDEYDVLRERLRDPLQRETASEKLTRLEEQERRVMEALARVRDRLYGRAGRLAPDASEGTRRAVTALRGWRNLVASGKLGVVALTGGVTDLARIVAEFGFAPTMQKMTKLVTSREFRDLSKAQARRMGAAVEVALSRRVNVAFDGAITEGWTQRLADGVYRWSGLNHITDFNRTLSATLLEDKVLEAAAQVAAGKSLPKWTRTRLAALGLNRDTLRRIHGQVTNHGGKVDGIRVSGSADWDDVALAEIYDAAIVKESRIVVPEPGAADRVWWMDSEVGRVIGQLKSFAFAAPMKITLAAVQAAGQREYGYVARFIGAMMMGGYLAHALRQLTAGKEPTTDPKQAAAEAFTESGLAGVLPDIVSPVARRVGLFGESVRYSDRNVLAAFGGPALGTISDAYDFTFNRTADGMSANDLRLLRRLLPYQNVWWLRRAINALEGETAEALDLKGAETRTFPDRFLETSPLLPATERGGTGTGRVAQ